VDGFCVALGVKFSAGTSFITFDEVDGFCVDLGVKLNGSELWTISVDKILTFGR
jgi:hypothetical protein